MDDGDASPPPSRLGLFLHEASRPVDWRRALNMVIAALKSRSALIRPSFMLTSPFLIEVCRLDLREVFLANCFSFDVDP